ncbi:MAG: thymidine kinase [Bacilli bacterium]|nr:thymidine kinase [Bacilli bacterium]
MAKLYFTYGAMGSGKTVVALMTRFNYIELGMNVLFIKPATDTRDGVNYIKTRIGLQAEVEIYSPKDNILEIFEEQLKTSNVVIVDEVQFSTKKQIEELKYISEELGIDVLTYGLRTDFSTSLFPGSSRLFELADTIRELKSMCHCGNKAIVNARYQDDEIIYEGEQIFIGGNDKYKGLCHRCWKNGNLK